MTQVFDSYARYYDLLYKNKDYGGEVRYVESLMQQYAPGTARILELGCGTGVHAEFLARKGYIVHGIDLSASMLEQGEQRKAKLPKDVSDRLTFELGDVRSFESLQKFDVVISLFHVFSYQTTNDDLQAAFKTAADHLDEGGVLIFDYWYGPAVLTQVPEVRVSRLEDETIKVTRIAEPELFYNENRVMVNYDVQIEEKQTGLRREVIEKHDMRYLFLPEIQKFGLPWFNLEESRAWMTDHPPSVRDWCVVSVFSKSA